MENIWHLYNIWKYHPIVLEQTPPITKCVPTDNTLPPSNSTDSLGCNVSDSAASILCYRYCHTLPFYCSPHRFWRIRLCWYHCARTEASQNLESWKHPKQRNFNGSEEQEAEILWALIDKTIVLGVDCTKKYSGNISWTFVKLFCDFMTFGEI